MTVAFDAKATTDAYHAATASFNIANMTVGAGSNRALIVSIVMLDDSSTERTNTLTWDSGGSNQIMSLIAWTGFTTSDPQIYHYGLVNPASGNKTLAVSIGGGNAGDLLDVFVGAASFTGVDQTGGSTTFYGANPANGSSPANGSGTTASVNISALSGDAAVSAMWSTASIASANHSSVFIDNTNGSISTAAMQYALATGTTTMSFTQSSGPWATSGFAIKAASGAPPPSGIVFRRPRSLLGTRAGSRQVTRS